MPLTASAVAFSANAAIGSIEASVRLDAASHQAAAMAGGGRQLAGLAAQGPGTHGGPSTQQAGGASQVPQPSSTTLLAAACGALLLFRRRTIDNSVR